MATKSINKFSFQKNGDTYELDITSKADLVNGVIPLNQLPGTFASCVVLQSITTVPSNFLVGQIYYNSSDNKFYLNVSVEVGIVDWTSNASSQILKFSSSYYTYSGSLKPIGQSKISSTVPSSATATGNSGEIRYDANYIYICFATNQWKRSPLTTW